MIKNTYTKGLKRNKFSTSILENYSKSIRKIRGII